MNVVGADETGFSASPNPSNGIFLITMKGISENELIQTQVLDISGRVVYEKKDNRMNGEEWLSDLSSLAKGVYYINCRMKEGNSYEKIVIE